jgi:hypothetical protein
MHGRARARQGNSAAGAVARENWRRYAYPSRAGIAEPAPGALPGSAPEVCAWAWLSPRAPAEPAPASESLGLNLAVLPFAPAALAPGGLYGKR